jgi:EAL domain-containing protein (putative c-di-GMP-specific phosphodiesterase class I)
MTCVKLGRLLTQDLLELRFQPIFDIAGATPQEWAVEGLVRGPGDTNFHTSNVLFDYVRLKHEEIAVDRHCVAKILREGADLPPHLFISMNVHAATLEKDPSFGEFVSLAARRSGVDSSRVIIEIVEQGRYWNTASMRNAVAVLHGEGMSIALDDIGCGFCNYQMIVDLHPQYLKLDRYFIHDCPTESSRQAVLRSLQQLARDVGAEVIAEGVESEKELETIRSIGVRLGQGFVLGSPVPARELAAGIEPVYASCR